MVRGCFPGRGGAAHLARQICRVAVRCGRAPCGIGVRGALGLSRAWRPLVGIGGHELPLNPVCSSEALPLACACAAFLWRSAADAEPYGQRRTRPRASLLVDKRFCDFVYGRRSRIQRVAPKAIGWFAARSRRARRCWCVPRPSPRHVSPVRGVLPFRVGADGGLMKGGCYHCRAPPTCPTRTRPPWSRRAKGIFNWGVSMFKGIVDSTCGTHRVLSSRGSGRGVSRPRGVGGVLGCFLV
mmetsp:Transcript_19506/g.46881  ORF Transcript_19506/g.46881 Transcript_19506/m.46881 type:complete len:240 (-) Transcript_19506:842-1561(-)